MGDQSKKKILIIDDAEVNQLLLSRILADYELLNAHDGGRAIELLQENGESLDLVILDLVLPDKSRLELLQFMKADEQLKEIPVIVMSAQAQMEQTTMEMGAVEFWKKPFWNAQEVQNRVAKVLG